MATYFVSSSGANTAPYSSWSTAATSLATALAAATTSGDIVVIQYNAVPSVDSEVSATTVWTCAANISVISASNNGGVSYTPTAMDVNYWLGNSTANRSIAFTGSFVVYAYGLTFRTAGATTGTNMNIGNDTDMQLTLDTCYFWFGNTSSSSNVTFGSQATNSASTYIKIRNSQIRLGNTGQNIRIAATVEMEDCSFASVGSSPTQVFGITSSADPGGSGVTCIGCDWSYAATGADIVGDALRPPQDFKFIQCKLPTSYVLLAAQTATNRSSARIWLYDCSSGDTHGIIEYADALGSIVVDTGIYYTSNPAAISWKVTTTSDCNSQAVFETPWIDFYNTATSSITPRLEILRDGSTTAYTNNEVWSNFFVKDTSGTTKSTLFTDRVTLAGTPANQATGAGLGSWTGESGTAWSGKVDTGAAVTPAEVGMIRARLCVGIPSATVYVDPYIRTA